MNIGNNISDNGSIEDAEEQLREKTKQNPRREYFNEHMDQKMVDIWSKQNVEDINAEILSELQVNNNLLREINIKLDKIVKAFNPN